MSCDDNDPEDRLRKRIIELADENLKLAKKNDLLSQTLTKICFPPGLLEVCQLCGRTAHWQHMPGKPCEILNA